MNNIIMSGLFGLTIICAAVAVWSVSLPALVAAGLLTALIMLFNGALLPAVILLVTAGLLPFILGSVRGRSLVGGRAPWPVILVGALFCLGLFFGGLSIAVWLKPAVLHPEFRFFDWTGLAVIIVVALAGAANWRTGDKR